MTSEEAQIIIRLLASIKVFCYITTVSIATLTVYSVFGKK